MKKVIFKNGLRAFLAAFCLLVLGVVGVNAQSQIVGGMVPGIVSPPTPNTPLYNVPQGTFVSSSVAITKLGIAIEDLKQLMMNPGTDPAVIDAAMIKAAYYGRVAEFIKVGATVPKSIVAGLWYFLTDASGNNVSTSTQQQLKNDVTILLQ